MKCKEEKHYYESGQLYRHYFVDENHNEYGEFRSYYKSGKLRWHYLNRSDAIFGEAKMFNEDGTLWNHYLVDGKGKGKVKEIANVIEFGKPDTHSEEELIQIAKDNNLPLLSELPKAEVERTLWYLKHPDMPCLPITST